MLLQEERESIVEYGLKMISSGLTVGTGGNLSIFNREKNLLAISPSGIDYEDMNPSDVVVMTLEGDIIDGHLKPSSELDLHRIFYKKRDDIDSIIHTHSMFCTVLSTLRKDLPASNYYIALTGGNNVRCSEYATFGTEELALKAYEAMHERYACLLANHGAIAGSRTLKKSFQIAEELERQCEIYVRAMSIGKPYILDDSEVSILLDKFKSYGQ